MSSIYRTASGRAALLNWYECQLQRLPLQVECRRVPTSAGSTHILEAGRRNAPPLIVLHGMNMNAPAMASALVPLSVPHRVYAIDIIGMPGRSAPTRLTRTGGAYPLWLAEVMDALKLARASFLGLSFGGWLILRLAALSPECISKAVLLDPGGLTPFTLKGQAIAGLAALRYRVRPTAANLRRAAVSPFFAEGCDPDPNIVELIGLGYQHVRFDIDPKGLPILTRDDLDRYRAPTLVMYGEHDIFFNAEKSIRQAQTILPNLVAAEIIAGQGHLLGLGVQASVYNRVSNFLASDSL